MSMIDEMRKRAIEAHVHQLAKTLSKERSNELLYGTKWPDPLTTTYKIQWGEPMNDDYVERARNATIEECASHLIAVQMDNAEAYAKELRTMKREDVPNPWWMREDKPTSEPTVIPWKAWFGLCTAIADAAWGGSAQQPDPMEIDELARARELRWMDHRFRPASRPEGYEVPEP
jgi:hypothetical protein